MPQQINKQRSTTNRHMLLLFLLTLLSISSILAICPCGVKPIDGIGCVACRLGGTIRLSLDRSKAQCNATFPNTNATVRPNPCLFVYPDDTTVIAGTLICSIRKCDLTPIETDIVRTADCKCGRLSPISFQFQTGVVGSPCQSYVRNEAEDGGCVGGASAFCVYPEISDTIPTGILDPTSVYTQSDDTLLETTSTPFATGVTCPPLDDLTLAASLCLSSTQTPVPNSTDLASVMAQDFRCPLGIFKRIVNDVVNCYRITTGPADACTTGTATCFYTVPKCRT